MGIRGGSSGTNPFMRTYGRFWPAGANCLMFADGDNTGQKWFEGAESFAERLVQLCRKVAVVRCGAHKDFNDLYRAEIITPEQIGALLASHGMALEGGVAA
jgi:hypothetical protein